MYLQVNDLGFGWTFLLIFLHDFPHFWNYRFWYTEYLSYCTCIKSNSCQHQPFPTAAHHSSTFIKFSFTVKIVVYSKGTVSPENYGILSFNIFLAVSICIKNKKLKNIQFVVKSFHPKNYFEIKNKQKICTHVMRICMILRIFASFL